jgi:cytochrome c oxidase subunit 1
VHNYPDAYLGWNAICSYGSYLSVLGAALFFFVVLITLSGNESCDYNPWASEIEEGGSRGSDLLQPSVQQISLSPTLEWLLPSPPKFHTFEEEIPCIKAYDSF